MTFLVNYGVFLPRETGILYLIYNNNDSQMRIHREGDVPMTVRINQMLSLRIEMLLANGWTRQDMLTQLKKGTFAREQQVGDRVVDFTLLIDFAAEQWRECEQAVQDGYRVIFHTINGVKSLLAVKFGLQDERDYQDNGDHLDGIQLSNTDVEWLQSVLAMNWRVVEQDEKGADPKVVQIRLAAPQE